MTLSKTGLPSSVPAGGRLYRLRTDFRYALLFIQNLKEDAPLSAFDFMYDGAPPENREEGVRAILQWLNPPSELPREGGAESEEILLDYEKDAPLIFAAFWERYGLDLLDEGTRLHWYKFRALLDGLRDTKLNDVMRIRAWRPDPKDPPSYRKEMARLKEAWRIEPELTAEEQNAVDAFDALLKG